MSEFAWRRPGWVSRQSPQSGKGVESSGRHSGCSCRMDPKVEDFGELQALPVFSSHDEHMHL